MKYKKLKSKGFMKAWLKSGLKYWYIFLIEIVWLSVIVDFLEQDFSGFNVQIVVITTLLLLSIWKLINNWLIDKVLDNMVKLGFMVKEYEA